MNRLVGLLQGAMSALNIAGSVWIMLIMLLITADVCGRAFFNSPLFGVPEIVKVSVVGIVWCQMAHTLRIGAHLRSTIIADRMPPGLRRVVELLACALGATIFALIVYSGWDATVESWSIGEFEGEDPVRVPTYPIRTLLLIGAALTAIQFVVMFVDVARGKSLEQSAAEF